MNTNSFIPPPQNNSFIPPPMNTGSSLPPTSANNSYVPMVAAPVGGAGSFVPVPLGSAPNLVSTPAAPTHGSNFSQRPQVAPAREAVAQHQLKTGPSRTARPQFAGA